MASGSEWFGRAPFPSPKPAPLDVLRSMFPAARWISQRSAEPAANGETMVGLHNRCSQAISTIIDAANAERTDPHQPEALLLCTHAAIVIALGRVLTGRLRQDQWVAGDFDAFTCGVSKFVQKPSERGVAWECEVNSGVEHLSGGGERNW